MTKPILDRKAWFASRDITVKEADKISGQLRTQYLQVRKVMRGEPVPPLLLELELVQLVTDVQRGRFPIKYASSRAPAK